MTSFIISAPIITQCIPSCPECSTINEYTVANRNEVIRNYMHHTQQEGFVSSNKNIEIPQSLDEEAFTIQYELMRRIAKKGSIDELSDEDGLLWVQKYSELFRILINGQGGAYDVAKDTSEAQKLRALYFSDEDDFYNTVLEKLKEGIQHH